MLDVHAFFHLLAERLRQRSDVLEASFTSGVIEHWVATEAAGLLHSERENLGIGGYREQVSGIIPDWHVAREVARIDLWVEHRSNQPKADAFAFELKVIFNHAHNAQENLNVLWNQISGNKPLPRRDGEWNVHWYGIVLAYYASYLEGHENYAPLGGRGNCINEDEFFRFVYGADGKKYDSWEVLEDECVWSSNRMKTTQYLDSNKPSSVRLYLIGGHNAIAEKCSPPQHIDNLHC